MMDTHLLLLLGLLLINPTCQTLLLKRQEEVDLYQYCSGTTCGKYGYSYIQSRFPGIFYTREEFTSQQARFDVVRQDYLWQQGVKESVIAGDGDSCCPTEIQMFTNYTMENVYGQTKYVVHMPPKYQYIPHGFCLYRGTCDGVCAIEPMTYTLLTYNPLVGTLEFDQFIVPGYCSCKAT